MIRRTLHGRRFADYAVARYTLTAVGPAVTGRAGGGEGESAVNRLGAIREEGLIIELDGRLHGPAVWTMGSDKGGLRIRPIQKTESPPLFGAWSAGLRQTGERPPEKLARPVGLPRKNGH